jgi:tetratricopeptide (TPR) repeat protein
MTEFRVICRYLMLLVLPLPRFFIFDNWGFAPSLSISNPPSTVISIAIIGLTTVMAVLARKKLPLLSFGILWYMIAISLESFIAVGSDFYYEHRNYLPVAGLFFGLTGQLTVSLKDILLNKRVLIATLLIISFVLGGLTYQRNHVWKDSVTLWTDTLLKNPNNLRAEMSLGNAYLKSVDLVSAGKHYQKAMELALLEKRPEFFHDAAYSLGMVNLFTGKLPEAKKVIDLMESQLAGKPATGILKGFYSSLSGDHETAIRLLTASLKTAVQLDAVTVHTLLGDTYRRTGQVHKALESYRQAINEDPSFSAAYYGMGNAYFLLKDMNNAELYTDKALLLDPVNPLALSQMVDIILIKKGPLEKAMQFAEKSLAASPPFYQPYAAMGTVLIVMGREAAAEEYFNKANEKGLRGYLLPYTKARAYLIKGDKHKAEAILREIATMDDAPADLRNIIKRDQGRLL